MDTFIHKLQNNIILSKADINLLREKVNEEYPFLDKSAKAHILARYIHSNLNESLRGFTKDYKSNIKTNLIRNTLLNNKETIYQYDVLKACASSQNLSLEFIYQVNRWINKQLDKEIKLSTIKNILNKITVIDNDIKEDISLSEILEYTSLDESKDTNTNIDIDTHTSIDINVNPSTSFTISNDNIPLDAIQPLEEEFSSDEEIPNSKDTPKQAIKKHNDTVQYIIDLKNKIIEIIETNISNEDIRKYILIYSLALCLLTPPATNIMKFFIQETGYFIEVVATPEYSDEELNFNKDNDIVISEELKLMTNHLPDNFKYKNINKKALRNYLVEKNSILSKEPYFSTILQCAKEFNLNPIVLFAITGQEQSFVPNEHKLAKKMVNNPYNVFGSWEEYNTNLADSSKIVCRTVINLLKERPENEDPFKWINRKYAGDKNWWRGVKTIYYALEEITE